MSGDEPDLHEYFAAVRREEEARVPPMAKFALRGHRRGPKRLSGRLAVATAGVAIVIASALWLVPGRRVQEDGSKRQAASISTWRPGTDFLLETPGREVLREVPELGEWSGEVVTSGGARHGRAGQQVVP